MTAPTEVQAQLRPAIELAQGVGGPLGQTRDWRAGMDLSLSVGMAGSVGPIVFLAAPFELHYGQCTGDGAPFDRFDVGPGVEVLAKWAPVVLGGHLWGGVRATSDVAAPPAVDPVTGESVEWHVQFGLDVGPALWWPVSRNAALVTRLDYQLTADSAQVPGRGFPTQALAFRLGLLLSL